MKMLEFLVDIISVDFAVKVFQQTVGMPMCTHCASLLVDNFLYSYEVEFIQLSYSALFGEKKPVSISVQSHLQAHR